MDADKTAAFDNQEDVMPVREVVTPLPATQLTPPYEIRSEMTWVDFSCTTNPLGTPPDLMDAITAALASGDASYVPDRDSYTLKRSLSTYFSLPTSSFLVGTSPNDLIRAVAQTYQPCTVGITSPSEVGYALAIGNAGHAIVEMPSHKGFRAPDPSAVRANGLTFDAALLANPSYPSSRLLQRSTLIHYLEACSWVILDERSIELALYGESYVQLTQQYRNLIVVRSMIESFALPGIPVSYLVAHPDTISQIKSFYDNSSIPMFAEVIGSKLLEHTSHLERAREYLETEIPWFQCMLSLIPGIDIFPAEGNYVLCSYTVQDGMSLGVKDVSELAHALKRSGFLVHPLNDIAGLAQGKHFCVAVKTRAENEKLLKAMRRIIMSE